MRFRTAIAVFLLLGIPPWATESSASAPAAARGLVERLLPEHAGQFILETVASEAGHDVFEIESRGGKIVLRGNDGVAIASALNRYLKDYGHADIS